MSELRKAAFDGKLDVVSSLFKKQKGRVNDAGPDTQRTALHWAVLRGQNQVAAWLVKGAKAKVDPVDSDGNTPLHLAIDSLTPIAIRLLMIDLLLAHGADPTILNRHGKTPLMSLIQLGRQISSVFFYHQEVMKNIKRKVEENIRQKAEQLNQTYSILPDGEVIFEETSVPLTSPHDGLDIMWPRGP